MKVDQKKYDLYQCANCNLTSLNPLPNENELSKYYPSDYKIFLDKKDLNNKNQSFLFKLKIKTVYLFRLNYLENTLNKFSQNNINYLDYGCGNGKNIFSLHAKYSKWNFIGYDKYNNKILNQNKNRILFINHKQKLEQIEDNFFDIINLSSVIEHVSNPKNLITFLKKKLNTNGLIIIKTPNFNSISRKIFG